MGHTPSSDPSRVAPTDPAKVVESAWQDQALWSAVATEMAVSIRRWRFIAAGAGVLGLFLTVLAGTLTTDALHDRRGQLTTLGVLLLALVPYVRQKMLAPERLQAWVRARNVSELLKEAVYRHLMGALPGDVAADEAVAAGTPPPSHPGALARRCRAIKLAAADLAGRAAAVTAPQRTRKLQLTLADYLEDRVEGQIRYYKTNGEQAGTAARRLHATEFVLGLLAVALGALSGQQAPGDASAQAAPITTHFASLVPWLTLVAAAASAVSAHIAATRFDELSSRYFATYDLLKSQRDEWLLLPDREDEAQVRQLVDTIERSISSENGAWVSDGDKAQ